MISFDIHLKSLAKTQPKRQLFIFCKLSYIDIIILKEFNILIFVILADQIELDIQLWVGYILLEIDDIFILVDTHRREENIEEHLSNN